MILVGIPSGDLECWCFLVDRKTFVNVTGRLPEKHDIGRFAAKGGKYKYMLYPNHFVPEDKGKPVVLAIESKVVG